MWLQRPDEKINIPKNQNTRLQTGLDVLELNLDLKVHMEGSSYRFSARQLGALLTRSEPTLSRNIKKQRTKKFCMSKDNKSSSFVTLTTLNICN